MPVFRQSVAVEVARNLRAFLKLEAGVTRFTAPRRARRDGSEGAPALASVSAGNQQLEGDANRARVTKRQRGGKGDRGRQLERARRLLASKDREIAALRAELDDGSTRAETLKVRGRDKERETQIRALRAELEAARRAAGPADEDEIVDRFHELYYGDQEFGGTWFDTYWMGVSTWKCPLDLWVYQEILFETKPDFVIETGTAHGGSALFLAHICDLLGKGRVITIDIKESPNRPHHERITYLHGSSTSEEILSEVKGMVGDGSALVILDSDHSKDHVLAELKAYSPFVNDGGYLVVEDTNVNGHPVLPEFGPGPMEAVEAFLEDDEDFAQDESKEKFYMTFNPGGFLKKGPRNQVTQSDKRRLPARAPGGGTGHSNPRTSSGYSAIKGAARPG